jgi:integrase
VARFGRTKAQVLR